MQKDNGIGKLDIKKRHFIIVLLMVLLIVTMVVIGSRIYSVSVVGTVVVVYEDKFGNRNADVEVKKGGLVDSDTAVTFELDEEVDLKEGDKVWVICDRCMNLSNPAEVSPIYIFKL